MIRRIHEVHRLPLDVARDVLDEVLTLITYELAKNGRVELRGFGVFELRAPYEKARSNLPDRDKAKPWKHLPRVKFTASDSVRRMMPKEEEK